MLLGYNFNGDFSSLYLYTDLNLIDERLLMGGFELHVAPLTLDVVLTKDDDGLPAVLDAPEDLAGDVLAHVPVPRVDADLVAELRVRRLLQPSQQCLLNVFPVLV